MRACKRLRMEGFGWRATSRILGTSDRFIVCGLGTTLMQPLPMAGRQARAEVTKMKRVVETAHGPTGAAEEAI